MANGYTSLVGAMPNPKTLAWFDWYRELLAARQQEVEEAVSGNTVLYFSTTGNNANPGTLASPKQTLAHAQTLMASNTTFLFKCGDEWAETAGLTINGLSKVKIGTWTPSSFTSAAPPLFSNFTVAVAASGWTDNTGVDGTWYRSVASEVGWVRETTVKDKRANYLRNFNSAAGAGGSTYAWHWNSGTSRLHIRMANAADDPNAYTFEYSLASSFSDGILVQDSDLVLIEGIRTDGWGARLTTSSDRYGIRLAGNSVADCRVVVRDCQAFCNGTHNFGSNQETVKAMFLRNTAGGAINQSSGTISGDSTPFVHYANSVAGTEGIYEGNTIVNGDLPTTSIAGGYRSNNNSFYAHDASNTTQWDLLVWSNNTEKIDTTRSNYISVSGQITVASACAPGTEGDESTYRTFFINHRRDLPLPCRISYPSKVWQANHRYFATFPSGDTTNVLAPGSVANGHCVNLILYLRDNQNNQQRGILPSGSSSSGQGGNQVKLWHCSYLIDGLGSSISPGQQFHLQQVPATADQAHVKNCLFVRVGDKAICKYTGNASANNVTDTNAFFNARWDANAFASWDNSTNPVKLSAPLDIQQSMAGAEVVGIGLALGLEYDNELNPRPFEDGALPTIGAIEGAPLDLDPPEAVAGGNQAIPDILRRQLQNVFGNTELAADFITYMVNPTLMSASEYAAVETRVINALP
jgi:hypothetical protein